MVRLAQERILGETGAGKLKGKSKGDEKETF